MAYVVSRRLTRSAFARHSGPMRGPYGTWSASGAWPRLRWAGHGIGGGGDRFPDFVTSVVSGARQLDPAILCRGCGHILRQWRWRPVGYQPAARHALTRLWPCARNDDGEERARIRRFDAQAGKVETSLAERDKLVAFDEVTLRKAPFGIRARHWRWVRSFKDHSVRRW